MEKPTNERKLTDEEFERELDKYDKLEAIDEFFNNNITLGELCGRFDIPSK